MKKHLFQIVLFLAGMTMFTSCMKNLPETNSTIFYGYQQIPNINEYMPQRLLKAMDTIYYGDEPPKIEGCFLADTAWNSAIDLVPSSNYVAIVPNTPAYLYKFYFNFYDQHMGIAKIKYTEPHGMPGVYQSYTEQSESDSAYYYLVGNEERFINDSIAPIYFSSDQYNVKDFGNVYIIGADSCFTAYYYEIRDMNQHFQPMNAVIISGRIDKEIIIKTDSVNQKIDTIAIPIIKDLVWGNECMLYLNGGLTLNQMIEQGFQRTPGDLFVRENRLPARHVDSIEN